MIRRVGLAACALVLLAVTAVAAQQMVTGTVVRIDQPAGVVVLDNGQMYQVTPQTVFLVNNQPSTFATLTTGVPVVVQSGQPVVYRDGRYVAVAQPAPGGAVVAAPGTLPPAARAFEVSGVVRYSDPVRRIIRFEDGRNVSIDENVQVLANCAPVMLSTLTPVTFVVVRSSKPLAFRGNTYDAVSGTPVVTSPPPAVASAPVAGTVVRMDQPNLIVISDGSVIPATAQTLVMVDNRPVPVNTLRPGSNVVIYPNGQAAVVTDPSALPKAVYPEAGLREKELERNAP